MSFFDITPKNDPEGNLSSLYFDAASDELFITVLASSVADGAYPVILSRDEATQFRDFLDEALSA